MSKLLIIGRIVTRTIVHNYTQVVTYNSQHCCVRENRIWMWNWGSGDDDVQS